MEKQARCSSQDTFTFEYVSTAKDDLASDDYLNNIWSNNWNHFEGEVPLTNPTVMEILDARPKLRELMAELDAHENQFWLSRYAMGNNNGRSDRNNTYQRLYTGPGAGGGGAANNNNNGTTIDFFTSCPQGTTSGSKHTAAGTYHSCPTLHMHGDNYAATPPAGPSSSQHAAVQDGEQEENKVDSRISVLKGIYPSISFRKPKPYITKFAPSCKICSGFGLNTPPACVDNPSTIYEAYKRNCTYRDRDVFERQEVLNSKQEIDPAEPIRILFDSNPSPSLEEIGRALLPATGGMVSPSTPANWVQELIDLLGGTPAATTETSSSTKLTTTGSPQQKTSSAGSTSSTTKFGTKLRSRITKFVFPKSKPVPLPPRPNSRQNPLMLAKPSPSPSFPVAIATSSVPKLKQLRVSLSKKLLRVKSRYMDHYQKTAAAASMEKKKDNKNDLDMKMNAGRIDSGDGLQIVGLNGMRSLSSSQEPKTAAVGAKGDALVTQPNMYSSSMKPIAPMPTTHSDSFLRLMRTNPMTGHGHDGISEPGTTRRRLKFRKRKTTRRRGGRNKSKSENRTAAVAGPPPAIILIPVVPLENKKVSLTSKSNLSIKRTRRSGKSGSRKLKSKFIQNDFFGFNIEDESTKSIGKSMSMVPYQYDTSSSRRFRTKKGKARSQATGATSGHRRRRLSTSVHNHGLEMYNKTIPINMLESERLTQFSFNLTPEESGRYGKPKKVVSPPTPAIEPGHLLPLPRPTKVKAATIPTHALQI